MNERRKASKAREVEKMLRAALEKNRQEYGRTIRRLKAQRDEAMAARDRWPEAVAKVREQFGDPLGNGTYVDLICRRIEEFAVHEAGCEHKAALAATRAACGEAVPYVRANLQMSPLNPGEICSCNHCQTDLKLVNRLREIAEGGEATV